MPTSPDVLNYLVGKGVVKWKGDDDPGYRDLGNSGSFEFTPNVGLLPHYSSRRGRKFKDFVAVQQYEMTFKLTLDEITPENLQLALLGSTESDGRINIMDLDIARGAIRFIGTNDVGAKHQVDLPHVQIHPGAAVGWISDGYAQLEVTGEITGDTDTGSFGTIIPGITGEVANP